MQALRYTVTTLSPVVLSMNVGEMNTVNTRKYINGSAVLGMFAQHYIKQKKIGPDAHQDESFCTWFLGNHLIFTNAYIVKANKERTVYYPTPVSMQQKKHDKTQAFDVLFRGFEKIDERLQGIEEHFVAIQGNYIETCDVKTSLNFHHARNPETGTTKEGQIFNYESLDPGQTFEGLIIGKKQALQEFRECFERELTGYLGRSKRTQYGKVRVGLVSKEPETFSAEIEDLNLKTTELSLTLLSDLILYNERGFATTDVKTLQQHLQSTVKELEIIHAFIETGYVENFMSVWRLPRPAERCFKAGSAFHLKVPPQQQSLLLKLQRDGIGERRNEGFGRIVVGWQPKGQLGAIGTAYTIHAFSDQQRSNSSQESQEPQPPETETPKLTSSIVRKIINNVLKKQIELQALKKAETFTEPVHRTHPPTKSLIGRLEAMVKTANSTKFPARVEALRKTAKDKLIRCRNSSETLFDFLQTNPVDINRLLAEHPHIQKLAEEIGYAPQNDTKLSERLYDVYFSTFFALMRKRVSHPKGGE